MRLILIFRLKRIDKETAATNEISVKSIDSHGFDPRTAPVFSLITSIVDPTFHMSLSGRSQLMLNSPLKGVPYEPVLEILISEKILYRNSEILGPLR